MTDKMGKNVCRIELRKTLVCHFFQEYEEATEGSP